MQAPAKKRVYKKKAASTAMVTMGRVYGRGAYSYNRPGPWGTYGRILGAAAGKGVAGPAGQLLGGKLGSYAHYIGKIFGSGDYVTAANAVKQNVLVNEGQIPQFVGSKDAIRVRHREFIGDIISSGTANTFQIQGFAINPGVSATFPWMSAVCGATFQQYRTNGMVFEFRSMSADALNSTNTALGTVIMATDYDSADAAFTTKSQMENTEFGVSCKPSSCMLHAIECAPRLTTATELYVRGQAAPSGTDIRLYDWGKFYIATAGCQGTNVNLGELWVSYDITVFKAIQQIPGYLVPTAHYQLDGTTWGGAPGLIALAGNTGKDNIGLTLAVNYCQWPLTIPVKSVWMVQLLGLGTATVGAGTIAAAGSGGIAAYSNFLLANAAVSTQTPSPAPSSTQALQQVVTYVIYNGGGTVAVPPKLTFSFTGGVALSAYGNGCDLVVTMVNGGLF